jgi:Protein of unknown function (DUF3298)
MQPLKFKIISWVLAFAIGVASTFVVQSCLRPISRKGVSQFQLPAPPIASSSGETATPPEALPFEAPPTEPWPNVSLKFSNYSISDKAQGFYTNEANYPQLTVLTTEAARRFNRHIEDLITARIADVRRQGRRLIREIQRKGEPERTVGGLTTTYAILFASPDFISIIFTHSYEWTFHPIASFESVNYDLKAGRPLLLRDIFKPGAKYLPALSKASRAKLVESLELSGVDSWMERGTAPAGKNFEAWNITPEGIIISFEDYQVGPYAMGAPSVTIPFTDLRNLLKSGWRRWEKSTQSGGSH